MAASEIPVNALLFDAFDTLADWRSSIVCQLIQFAQRVVDWVSMPLTIDWTAFVWEWRVSFGAAMAHFYTLDFLIDRHRHNTGVTASTYRSLEQDSA